MAKRLFYDDVKQYIENEGYTLLSKSYKNVRTKLKVRCPKGHEYEVAFMHFKNSGSRCPVCAGIKRLLYEDVKEYIEKNGYTLLSNGYKNNMAKLKIRCPKGHEYETTFANFQLGRRCFICSRKIIADKKRLSYDDIKQYIENGGYTLLSNSYKNNKAKLKVRCPKGHEYKVTFDKFKNGRRCPICNALKTSSKAEMEIANLIRSILPNKKVLCNDRTQIINPLTGYYLELDIFIPDLNKAIEYNGVYWHGLPKAIAKDKIKKEQCQEKNIDLFIIDEKEWLNDKNNTKLDLIKWIKGVI